MEYSELRELIDRSVEFPITHERLVDQLGTVELTPPAGEPVPLSEILTRVDEQTYPSPEMLYTTVVGNLDEAFVGRKHYDDRGGTGAGGDPRRPSQRSL